MVTYTRHSPGPWQAHGNDVLDADRMFVAEIVSENPLDASAIGAVPELLAALKAVLRAAPISIDDSSLSQAMSAIAKAEGR